MMWQKVKERQPSRTARIFWYAVSYVSLLIFLLRWLWHTPFFPFALLVAYVGALPLCCVSEMMTEADADHSDN